MRVIIIGAGNVGYVSAETICEVHDVMVVDDDPSKEYIKTKLNVSFLSEDGSNPRVIRDAIEKHRAEAVVSTLDDDTTNLFVCMIAKRVDPKILTIASVNDPDFRIELTSEGYEGVDMIISPEMKTAEKMYRMAILENVTDYEFVDSVGIGAAVYRVTPKIVGKIVLHLDLPEECSIFGIYRNKELILDVDTVEIREKDSICVIGTRKGLEDFNDYIGVENRAMEFVILSGSIVGANVAKMLLSDKRKKIVKIVDYDPRRCSTLTKIVPEAMTLMEDYKDPAVQASEDLFKADCLLVTSGSDDTNLLMCMSAKTYETVKPITRYSRPEYKSVFAGTGLDTIIGYHNIITNEITRCLLPDEVALMRMKGDNELFFTYEVGSKSAFCDKYLGDMRIPEKIKVVAISREGRIIYPSLDTKILEKDLLIVFTNTDKKAIVKSVFGKNVVPEL